MLILVICILAVCAAIQDGKKWKPREASPYTKTVARIIVVLVIYFVGTVYVGYLLSTVVFLIMAIVLLGERRIWVLTSVSLGWAIFAYLVFQELLHVPLPVGRWWEQLLL